MAKQILGPLTQITVNGTDLSDHCSQVQISDSADDNDTTGFAETYKEHLPGLKDATVTADFFQDMAASSVDAVIGAQYYANTSGTIKVKPDTSGTVVYTLVGKIFDYGPVNGQTGNPNSISVTWQNFGTAGLTRGTA